MAFGLIAGAVGALVWPLIYNPLFAAVFIGGLAIAGVCGAYILLLTWYDSYRNPRRGARIRPIRGFDIAAGIILLGLSAYGLYPVLTVLI